NSLAFGMVQREGAHGQPHLHRASGLQLKQPLRELPIGHVIQTQLKPVAFMLFLPGRGAITRPPFPDVRPTAREPRSPILDALSARPPPAPASPFANAA